MPNEPLENKPVPGEPIKPEQKPHVGEHAEPIYVPPFQQKPKPEPMERKPKPEIKEKKPELGKKPVPAVKPVPGGLKSPNQVQQGLLFHSHQRQFRGKKWVGDFSWDV